MNKLSAIIGTIFILFIASPDFASSQGFGFQSRIVGGFEVIYHQYPYFSLIKVNFTEEGEEYQTNCGGSLIAKNVILTAAHCLGDGVSDIQVELNVIDKNTRQNAVSVPVIGWESHNQYSFRAKNVRNDIGLIYLKDTPRKHIEPVKIKFDGRPDPDDIITVMGFGTKGDGRLSDTLHVTFLDLLSTKNCRTIFKEVLNTDLQFCTGIRDSGKAACKGDSGGPAVIRQDGIDIQVGLVSFGAPDCNSGMTGYTRVSGYESWLKERVCSRQYPPDWCGTDGLSNLLTSLTSGIVDNNNNVPVEENVANLAGCFSGSSTVEVKDIGQVQMNDLSIGDLVHVGKNIYEPIYSFGHRAQAARAHMVQISTETSNLQLTADHMVFTDDKTSVLASQIRVGDHVLDGNLKLVNVISVQNVTKYGLFNPFTPSGKIVVDNILSSNYIAFGDKSAWHIGSLTMNYHWMAHAAITPLRIACYHVGSCEEEKYSVDGILESLTGPLSFVQWVFAQNGVKRGVSMIFIFFILAEQYVAEKLILNPLAALVFVLALILCISTKFLGSEYFHRIGLSNFGIRGHTKIKQF